MASVMDVVVGGGGGQEEASGVHGPEQEHIVGQYGLEDSLGEYFDGKLNSLAGQAVQAVGRTFWLGMNITDVRDLSFFLHDLQYPIHHSE